MAAGPVLLRHSTAKTLGKLGLRSCMNRGWMAHLRALLPS